MPALFEITILTGRAKDCMYARTQILNIRKPKEVMWQS